MEFIEQLMSFVLHIDQHLISLSQQYNTWIYLILFLIIFCETGLVITPFLPGDSLLFALGALAADTSSGLNLVLLSMLLSFAAILGDSFNYYTGYKFGAKLKDKNYWFLRQKHILQAESFYEKYGGRTIIYARFVPIIRTFAPFVAGIGRMQYQRFFLFNIVGALVWVSFFLVVGFLFGNLPVVKEQFSLLILSIIGISLLPPMYSLVKSKFVVRL